MKKLFPRKAAGKYVLKSPRLKSPNSVLDMRLKGWVKAAACGKANSFQVPSLANPKVMDSRLAVSQVKRFTKNTRWTKFLMPLLPILTCRILSPKLKALSNLIGSVNPRALSRAAICRVCTGALQLSAELSVALRKAPSPQNVFHSEKKPCVFAGACENHAQNQTRLSYLRETFQVQ